MDRVFIFRMFLLFFLLHCVLALIYYDLGTEVGEAVMRFFIKFNIFVSVAAIVLIRENILKKSVFLFLIISYFILVSLYIAFES